MSCYMKFIEITFYPRIYFVSWLGDPTLMRICLFLKKKKRIPFKHKKDYFVVTF